MSPRVALLCADAGIPWLGCGGASVHLRSLAAGYVAAGATVEAWVARLDPHPGRPSALTPPGVRVLEAPASVSAWAQRQAARFAPDLLHERHAARVGPDPAAGLHLVEVNAPLTWEAALFRGKRATRAKLDAELASLRRAAHVVVVSSALQRWLATHDVAAHVLPNAVSTRSPASPPEGRFVLGFEGTFKAWHGLVASVASLELLHAQVGPVEVELIGDGPERQALQQALDALSIPTRWLGELDARRVATHRVRWSACWSPHAPWPPPGAAAVERALGRALPERWFAPLKEAEAAAAGLPLWRSGPDLVPAGPPPRTWQEVGRGLLGLLAGRAELWDDGPRS